MNQWMDFSMNSNRYIQTYFNGFVDISGGNLILRNNNNINVYSGYIACGTNIKLEGNTGNITCTNLLQTSDSRIKRNVQPINGSFALDAIRNIQPVSFQFIEPYTNNEKSNLGFIAQQVKPFLEQSVETREEFIPNILDGAVFIDSKTIRLKTKSTSLFSFESLPFMIRFYDSKRVPFEYLVEEIVDDTTFRLSKSFIYWTTTEIFFVYGQQVHDFHSINHNFIYTVTTSALKELDSRIQNQDSIIREQQKEIDNLKEKIEKIFSEMNNSNNL
jgi:hypothetical protein